MKIQMATSMEKEQLAAEIATVIHESKLNIARIEAEASAIKTSGLAKGLSMRIKAFATDETPGVAEFIEYERIHAFWNSSNKVYYFGDSANHMPKAYVNTKMAE